MTVQAGNVANPWLSSERDLLSPQRHSTLSSVWAGQGSMPTRSRPTMDRRRVTSAPWLVASHSKLESGQPHTP